MMLLDGKQKLDAAALVKIHRRFKPVYFAMLILYTITVIRIRSSFSLFPEAVLEAGPEPVPKTVTNTVTNTVPETIMDDGAKLAPKEFEDSRQSNTDAAPETVPETVPKKVTKTVTKTLSVSAVENAVKKAPETDKDGIDWSDHIFSRRTEFEWGNDPIIVEKYKLMYFPIPKNACTTFKQLCRRMMGYEDWQTGQEHNPRWNGLKYLGHFPKHKQIEMMTSPEWTRAIFVRDPLERILSAYMEKGLDWAGGDVSGAHVKQKCCSLTTKGRPFSSDHGDLNITACKEWPFVPYENPLTIKSFPFEKFVKNFMRQCPDPHWRAQSEILSSPANYKFINFVGHFENKKEDTHALLKKIGAFEEFGASGWGNITIQLGGKKPKNITKSLGIFETSFTAHQTGSSKKVDRFYTDELRKLVYDFYRKDYDMEIFNFTRPTIPG